MAVTKMEKMTVIAAAEKEELVLQTLQGLQNIEVKSLVDGPERSLVEKYFSIDTPRANERRKELEEMLFQIQEMLQFIRHYSTPKKQALSRQVYTLEALESQYNEANTKQQLSELLDLRDRLEAVFAKRKECLAQEDWLGRWQYLDIDPAAADQLASVHVTIGVLNVGNQAEFLAEMAKLSVYVEEVYHSTNHLYYCLIYPKELTTIQEVLSRYSFDVVTYPYHEPPKAAYQSNKVQLAQLVEEEKAIKQALGKYSALIEQLFLTEEMILAYINREAAKQLVLDSDYLFVIQGWVPEDGREQVLNHLYRTIPFDEVFVEFEEPDQKEYGKVPTKLRNHKVVAPFEMLTEMYSLPKYDEIDPTPIMTPFYMVFFGMMVADIGYGLLMLLATLVVRKVLVLPRGMKRFADFFFILSFPTIIWGFIYGSFFGATLPPTILGVASPFPILSTTDDVNTILLLSVIFGFIQIMVGLMVNGIELTKRKQYLASVSESFAWQGLLVGILIAVVGQLLVKSSTLLWVGAGVALVSALLIVAVPVIQSKSKVKGFAKGLYGLYGLTGYIGDLVSYTRLMALGISGGSIAAAFNMLVAFMPPVARFTVGLLLIVALHALNIFLSLLSAYVHGARLQYVEFFGKFYQGGGRPFAPLKTAEKYINIQANKLKNEK
ncbi:V-type ATP synthase subunit I [Enterococcus canis]|nr:V-type ATP synthase subunit I [Enterococcus canis]